MTKSGFMYTIYFMFFIITALIVSFLRLITNIGPLAGIMCIWLSLRTIMLNNESARFLFYLGTSIIIVTGIIPRIIFKDKSIQNRDESI